MIAIVNPTWPTEVRASAHKHFIDFFSRCRQRPTLSLVDWAEKYFVIPEGPYGGYKFRYRRQPYALLLHRELQNPRWRRSAVTGCVQSGKTLHSIVMPLMHDVFELKLDTIGYGVPTMDMAFDKWRKELLPSIQKVHQFARSIPNRGKGSKGGAFESLQFQHGPEIKFASAHGGDEKRSGFTCPKFYVTEVDKLDEASETSREGAPIDQFEARTSAYEQHARLRMECTVSIPSGRIWIEYTEGSESKIACRCPYCEVYVTPEFEDLKGYHQAQNEMEAETLAHFECPECNHVITEDDRHEMNRTDDGCEFPAVLVHRGQSIDGSGKITGDLPQTYTLGFRWNAFNNMFWTTGWLGIQEWRCERDSEDSDDGLKVRWQFRWTRPYVPRDIDYIDLKSSDIQSRTTITGKGQKPEGTTSTTIGVDVGKWRLHWTAVSWTDIGGTIIDHGETRVRSDKYGTAKAIEVALGELRASLGAGWSDSQYDLAGIDIKYKPAEVLAALKKVGDKRWRPLRGLGSGQYKRRTFGPESRDKSVRWASDHGYERWDKKRRAWVMNADTNHWKTWLHERLAIDANEPDSDMPIVLYESSDPNEHKWFARHITAEKEITLFEDGINRGKKIVWEQIRDANHWLDSTYIACFMRERVSKVKRKVVNRGPSDDVLMNVILSASKTGGQ